VEGLLGLKNFATWLSRTIHHYPDDLGPDLVATFHDLAEASSGAFNDANPDDSRVYYQSWAGLSNVAGIANPQDSDACDGKTSLFNTGWFGGFSRHRMHILLKPMSWIVAHHTALLPTDGLVQVASAKWGDFRGCIPADHLDEVGGAPSSWTPFDHVRFYRNRAFELAARGF
jgi:triacylglycerol lipase